jgi:hypothetical protein
MHIQNTPKATNYIVGLSAERWKFLSNFAWLLLFFGLYLVEKVRAAARNFEC